MKRARTIASIGMLFSLVAGSADAQEEARRGGFWISVGIGAGVTTGDVPTDESRWGGAGFLRAGGVPDEHLVLGTEFLGWITDQNDVVTSRGVVTLFAQYYPSRTGGLFFKGGLGGAGISKAVDLNPGTLVTTNGGFGMTLGSGYEFRLSRITSLTANVDWALQVIDDSAGGTHTSSLFLFTIGLTFPRIG
jgi:hypothetical protein